MLVMLASVSLTVPYLGADRFGAWMLLSSFMAMLTFLDMGIGNALTNRVAAAAASDRIDALRTAINGGIGSLLACGVLAWSLLSLMTWVLPWRELLQGADAGLLGEVRAAGLVFSGVFAVNMVSTGIQKVFLGLQQSHLAHFANAMSSLLALFALWVCSIHGASVPWLLGATSGCQALGGIGLLVVLARRRLVSPGRLAMDVPAEMRPLLRTGSLFLVLQIGTLVGWGADSLIISSNLGAGEVAIYAIVQRLFMFATIPIAIMNQPLWGAYADAHARQDHAFIRKTVLRSIAVTALLVICLVGLLVLLHKPAIHLWTQGALEVPISLVLAFAIWTCLEAVATSASMYLNGCQVVRPQVVAVLVFCALSIPTKFVLASHLGLAGVVICTIISYVVAVPLLYLTFFRAEILTPLRGTHV